MKAWKAAVIFLLGAGAGVGAAYFPLKKFFREKADEEIQSVVDTFHKQYDRNSEDPEPEKEEVHEEPTWKAAEKLKVEDIIQKMNYSKLYKLKEERVNLYKEFPYEIGAGEYNEFEAEGWGCGTIRVFTDGIITDNELNPLDDWMEVIGDACLEHFNETEDGILYVRNEKLKSDYEVISDLRTFQEAVEGG